MDDPAAADFTLSIATPTTTDALCAPLETIGMWNCRNGTNVVLNSDRWTYGSPTFSSVDAYHVYEIKEWARSTLPSPTQIGRASCRERV